MSKTQKQNNLLLELALLVLLILLGFFIWQNYQAKKVSEKSIFCGGIAGISCPKGYSCKLDGNYPDAGGACIKSFFLQ